MPRSILAALLALAVPGAGVAQEARFELGQRLRLFERALDKYPSAEARRRALPALEQVTPTFFKGQLGAAAGLLDRARLLLASDAPPADEVVWAESLVVRPQRRLLPASAKELRVQVEAFYRVKAARPGKAQVRATLSGSDGKALAVATAEVNDFPATITLPLKDVGEGDHRLRCEILVAGKLCAAGEQTLSLAADLGDRLGKLKKGLAELPGPRERPEMATLARLIAQLTDLEAGKTPETNFPAHRLLTECEAVLAALSAGETYYGPRRAGQFWLTLGAGSSGETVRVQVPEAAKAGKPLPLVVALHGAGGSENMFFDAYGDGLAAKLCAKRGWLLAATRTPLLSFGGGPDVPRVIDALAKVYPMDEKKVFLVGHSMGAAQAVAAAGRAPERFRAVAALGGGGGFKSSDALRGVRFFVGCGDRDFTLTASRGLHRLLEKAGVKKAVFKEYAGVEHLIVVQLALPEVFTFFQEALDEPRTK
jgi:pimeloyl-ACP methyl ester carboxylesterase